MTARIEWVRQSCRMLDSIADEFERSQGFAGLTVDEAVARAYVETARI